VIKLAIERLPKKRVDIDLFVIDLARTIVIPLLNLVRSAFPRHRTSCQGVRGYPRTPCTRCD
jgi:hypothetical protein